MGLTSGGRPKTGGRNSKGASRRATSKRFRPQLEGLESRVVPTTTLTVGPNINVSNTPGDQAEAAIAVDPLNPKIMVAASNDGNAGLTANPPFSTTINRIYTSSDGGLTWTGRLITNGDITGNQGFGDPTVVFDQFGNLFFSYLNVVDLANNIFQIRVAVSTDGGNTFSIVDVLDTGNVDHPAVAVGAGTVWVEWANINPAPMSNPNFVFAAGAKVTGLGAVGAFTAPLSIPNSADGNFGNISVGPSGQVLVSFQQPEDALTGPTNIFVSTNLTGIGGTFGTPVFVAQSLIGGFQSIPAQPGRTIDAEGVLTAFATSGPHAGRVYLVYTTADNVDTFNPPEVEPIVVFSDDNGATWTPGGATGEVLDDAVLGETSDAFLPQIAVDPVTGDLAVAWYDTRNDPTNVTTQIFATVSTDGGLTFLPSVQVSAGTSNGLIVQDPDFNFGDYYRMAFFNGVFHVIWADNSGALTPGNPNLPTLDIATAAVTVTSVVPPSAAQFIATGAGAGALPEVKVFDAKTGALKMDVLAYAAAFQGGVRVAVGDVNGDGVDDIITAPGFGGSPDIRVFDGRTGALMTEFMAFDPRFNGGAFVAAKDLNGDGHADIIVGAGAGGGPEVKAFSGLDGSKLADFYAYDVRFKGGVTVAAGDLFGSGQEEIITGAGPGGGPHVKEFTAAGASLGGGFYAYDPNFNGGVSVAAGDVEANGEDQIVTGAGHGGGPNVRIFNGANGSLFAQFMAGPNATTLFFDDGAPFLSGVNVAVVDRNGDGHADIITGFGPGGSSVVQTFDGATLQKIDSFFAYNTAIPGGVFVGAA